MPTTTVEPTLLHGMGAARVYLTLYNAFYALAWTYVLLAVCAALLEAPSAHAKAYAAVADVVSLVQTASLLETLHAGAGLTRSGVLGNFAQWAGRTHCWWLVVARPELSKSAAIVVLMLTWSLADVIRYSWAALGHACPRALTVLRYSAFVVLYPLGAGAEVVLMALALPAAKAGFRRVRMPNAWNVGFDYGSFLFCVLIAYPWLWAILYKSLFRQRQKKLCSSGKKEL